MVGMSSYVGSRSVGKGASCWFALGAHGVLGTREYDGTTDDL